MAWSKGRLYQWTTGGGIPETLQVKVTVSPSLVMMSPDDKFTSIFGGTVRNSKKTIRKF